MKYLMKYITTHKKSEMLILKEWTNLVNMELNQ